jgi:starch synthase
MRFFQDLQKQFPEKVSTELKFDPVLPHPIFAGADAALIPSLFEPSGLAQMEAMHFGTIPIVRKTGGLADTVLDYSPLKKDSTGFVFERYDASSLLIAVVRAYENFQNKKIWRSLQKNAMTRDFSWENSAKKYEKLMEKARKIKSEMSNPKDR